MTDPNESYEKEKAAKHYEDSKNDVGGPFVESLIVVASARDSLVNAKVNEVGQVVQSNDSHKNIAYLARYSTVLLVLGQSLVFSTEHLRHFEIPVREQEVTNVPEHIT